jgi:hypothetical protein
MSESIEIIISKDGSEVKMDAIGFVGEACDAKMAPIQVRLGRVTDGDKKPDYFDRGAVDISTGL